MAGGFEPTGRRFKPQIQVTEEYPAREQPFSALLGARPIGNADDGQRKRGRGERAPQDVLQPPVVGKQRAVEAALLRLGVTRWGGRCAQIGFEKIARQ